MTDRGSTALVGAVLAGQAGNVARAVGSLSASGVEAWVFDTTPDRRHAELSRAGVTVVDLTWPNSFAQARNDALAVLRSRSEAACVLWLDGDEILERTTQARLSREVEKAVRGAIGLCPKIRAGAFSTQGVARLHGLRGDLRFRGTVHEYLETELGESVPYELSSIRIVHDDYGDWDRSSRNDKLSRRQIAEDPANPRWRPFWVRDSAKLLKSAEIVSANRQQSEIMQSGAVGGIERDVYTRMIAWHTSWHLVNRGAPDLVERSLHAYRCDVDEAASEILYLRLVALAIAGVDSTELMVRASALRQTSLADRKEYPWLDAGIAVALDASGRRADADAYRAESVPFSDAFCDDSRLRPQFSRKRLNGGAFSRA